MRLNGRLYRRVVVSLLSIVLLVISRNELYSKRQCVSWLVHPKLAALADSRKALFLDRLFVIEILAQSTVNTVIGGKDKMSKTKTYVVELSEHEIHSLLECLGELRKHYVSDGYGKPLGNPVFVAASELQYKIAHIVNPDSDTSLDDYLDYGK